MSLFTTIPEEILVHVIYPLLSPPSLASLLLVSHDLPRPITLPTIWIRWKHIWSGPTRTMTLTAQSRSAEDVSILKYIAPHYSAPNKIIEDWYLYLSGCAPRPQFVWLTSDVYIMTRALVSTNPVAAEVSAQNLFPRNIANLGMLASGELPDDPEFLQWLVRADTYTAHVHIPDTVLVKFMTSGIPERVSEDEVRMYLSEYFEVNAIVSAEVCLELFRRKVVLKAVWMVVSEEIYGLALSSGYLWSIREYLRLSLITGDRLTRLTVDFLSRR
jgi:hypothetical protein